MQHSRAIARLAPIRRLRIAGPVEGSFDASLGADHASGTEAIAAVGRLRGGSSRQRIRDAAFGGATARRSWRRPRRGLTAACRRRWSGIPIIRLSSMTGQSFSNVRAARAEESVEVLERLLQERPDDPVLMNALGYTLADHSIGSRTCRGT